MKRVFFIFLLVLCSSFVTALGILNPLEGTWGNPQYLLLSLEEGEEAYYSLNGTDPETSGFAYDEPVLIDLKGEINLKVTFIQKDGTQTEQELTYTVEDALLPEDKEASLFIKDHAGVGLYTYTPGVSVNIPETLEYSFGLETLTFDAGCSISLKNNYAFSRYLPCTLKSGDKMWRFIFNIKSGNEDKPKTYPFRITDWETITFVDKAYIYKIDDSWWDQFKESQKLDRSVPHIIYWQDIAFKNENIIHSLILPPRIEIKSEYGDNGDLTLIGDNDKYRLGVLDTPGLYTELNCDTFSGDEFVGILNGGIYYEGLLQSTFEYPFDVNRRKPFRPVITASAQDFSRKAVNVTITGREDTNLFVSVSPPVKKVFGKKLDYGEDNYKPSSGRLVLKPSNEGEVSYLVKAYSIDKNKNKSSVASYTVSIDSLNYYCNPNSGSDLEDGTMTRPYKSLDKIFTFQEDSRFLHIYLNGEVPIPDEKLLITSNIIIEGSGDSRLILSPSSSFMIREANFTLSNVFISYESSSEVSEKLHSTNIFDINHGVLDLEDSEVKALFLRNGTIIDSENSVISIKNTRLTSQADNYNSCISSVESKVFIKGCHITSSAGTAINFSSQGGLFELRDSDCKILGVMGRICELFDTQSSITDNVFNAELTKMTMNSSLVYMDNKNHSVEFRGNNTQTE